MRPASLSTRIDPFVLLSRRKSPLPGRASPRIDLLPLSLIYSPYAVAFRQHFTVQRRKESCEVRSGRPSLTPTEMRPTSLLRAVNKRQRSPLRQGVKHVRTRLRNKTPSPPRPSPHFQPDVPLIRIHRDDSQENVLQTPAEDLPAQPSGSLYEPEIKRSLEEYLAVQTSIEHAPKPVPKPAIKRLLQLPSLESVALTADSKDSHEHSVERENAHRENLKLREGVQSHRKLLLSGSLNCRSLTPTPPLLPRESRLLDE